MTVERTERAYAKRRDPYTSWLAADTVEDLPERQRAVWWVLWSFGPMTNDALSARYAKLQYEQELPAQTPQSVRSRRSELQVKGYARPTGARGVSDNGRPALIHEALKRPIKYVNRRV